MLTVPEYVTVIWPKQVAAGNQLGVNMYGLEQSAHVQNLSLLVLISVIIKALHDKGVVLDPEWQTRLNGALAGTWPDWVLRGEDPNEPPSVE